MSFFQNKHVVTAMIVAPVLAVLAYVATDNLVKETPHTAVVGETYRLIAKSNCRFSSGRCDLENASFRITLQLNDDSRQLELSSSHVLQKVQIGFVDDAGTEVQPVSLKANTGTLNSWSLDLPSNVNSQATARLAIHAGDAIYFAETGMQFSEYETAFNKDFRK